MLYEKVDPQSKNLVFIYTTCPTREEARSIGLSAINEKLAANIDYWPIGSIYPWQGVIQDVEQYMLVLTTEKTISEKLTKFVSGMHPYSTPIIAEIDAAAINPNYSFWIDTVLASKEQFISEHEATIKLEDEEESGYHYGRLK